MAEQIDDKTAADGPIIQETIDHVGSTPGSGNGTIPPHPGITLNVKAQGGKEYVAGSPYSWYNSLARALPFGIDDLTHDLGADLYSRMMFDSQVRASVNVFKSSILETGVTLTSPIDDNTDPRYRAAADLVTRAEKVFDQLSMPLDDTLWDLLDAVAVGNRIAEQVYQLDTTVTGKQEYVLSTLAVKPYNSYAFVVDAYLNILGVLGRIPGQPFGVQQGTLLADIQKVSNLLPASKFAILSFRPHNNDPRGTSILRAAYDPWWQKIQLKKEYLKYLSQFATPSLIGYTPEDAQQYQTLNPDGTPAFDALGNPILRTPEQDMVAALQAFANGTATAFPYGANVDALEMHGDGRPFQMAFDYLNREIVKSVLHQTLATEEGEHQARAASATHKDILDTVVRQGKRPVERMVRNILRTWAMLNGIAELDLLPLVRLGEAEEEDTATIWTALAALQTSHYIHPSQLADLDRMVGLPERTPPDEFPPLQVPPAEPTDEKPGQNGPDDQKSAPNAPKDNSSPKQTGGDDQGQNTDPKSAEG